MALPTGTISIADINTEIGRPATYANTNLNETIIRQTAASVSGTGILTGGTTISMNSLRGANATQVINNIGGTAITFYFNGSNLISYGVKTLNTTNFGAANIAGTMPANTLTIAGGGNASVADLYNYGYLSGPTTILDLTGSPTYTGNFNIWMSTNSSDTWPSTFMGTLTYSGTFPYTTGGGGTAYRWALTGPYYGDFQNMRSLRIAKA